MVLMNIILILYILFIYSYIFYFLVYNFYHGNQIAPELGLTTCMNEQKSPNHKHNLPRREGLWGCRHRLITRVGLGNMDTLYGAHM